MHVYVFKCFCTCLIIIIRDCVFIAITVKWEVQNFSQIVVDRQDFKTVISKECPISSYIIEGLFVVITPSSYNPQDLHAESRNSKDNKLIAPIKSQQYYQQLLKNVYTFFRLKETRNLPTNPPRKESGDVNKFTIDIIKLRFILLLH